MFSVGGGIPGQLEPAVWGDTVVWRTNRNGNWKVYATGFRTGEETPVSSNPALQKEGAISGHYVVWTDARNHPSGVPPEYGNRDIYGLDLQTMQEFPICTAPHDQLYPDISGNIVVWQDERRRILPFKPPWPPPEIYGYDLTTGQEFLIATDPDWPLWTPAISGDIVVWSRGGKDIWGKDLPTGEVFPVHVGEGSQQDPDIDGRWVVWEDWRESGQGIWAHDLLTGAEFPIYVDEGSQQYPHQKWPKVSGNLVVWESELNGQTGSSARTSPSRRAACCWRVECCSCGGGGRHRLDPEKRSPGQPGVALAKPEPPSN